MNKKYFWRVMILSLVFLLFCLIPQQMRLVPTAQAQEKSLYWERLDVEIDVQADGSFRVRERNLINFTSGTFSFGARTIPDEQTSAINDISVTVNGQPLQSRITSSEPGTFQTTFGISDVGIRYFFPQPVTGEQEIEIAYTVEGGLRYYEGGDQLYWKAVHADRPATVAESLVTVSLPPGVSKDAIVTDAYFTDAEIEVSEQGRTVTFRATESIQPGKELEIRVQFPHGLVSGSAPPWQAEADRRGAEADARAEQATVVNVLAGGLSFMLLVGGLVGLFLLWWRRGRDYPVELLADYLSEPPDELSAGMAGTLLDENAALPEVMATLLQLAQKGSIEIQETNNPKGGLFGSNDGQFTYNLLNSSKATTKAEKSLIKEFFGNQTSRKLDDLRNKFYNALPKIQEELYEEVTQAGLFEKNPSSVRTRYTILGFLMLFGAALLFFLAFFLQGDSAMLGLFCLPFAIGILGIALMITAQVMPRKTQKGSESASKWQAFRRYLEHIERYGDLEEKKQIWAEYLPFAVAFGLEKSYIKTFSKVNAPVPHWYNPYGYDNYRHGHGYRGSQTNKGVSGKSTTVQDSYSEPSGGLQGMSDNMGLGLQSMSDGLASMLSTTASTLISTPAPKSSGSSSSGGGFSGGGGGGGGGSSSFG